MGARLVDFPTFPCGISYVSCMLSLDQINKHLEVLSEPERIIWAHQQYANRLVLTTSFGTYSAVMLHLVKRHAPGTIVISVDTGHNEETRLFKQHLIEQLQLSIEQYEVPPPPHDPTRPLETIEEYLQKTKVDILEQALKKHQTLAWMSGVQRNETDHRKEFRYLMQRTDGLFKFHPLLDWDPRKLFSYCKEHELPVNDAYFDPAKGKDQKLECGIHLTGMANESFTSSEL